MGDLMKNYKKVIGIVAGLIVILVGGNFTMQFVDHNVSREHVFVGERVTGSDVVGMDRKKANSKNISGKLDKILENAKQITVVDEVKISKEEVRYSINYGTLMNNNVKKDGSIWFKEEGTAVLKDQMSGKYYEIDADGAKALKKLLNQD